MSALIKSESEMEEELLPMIRIPSPRVKPEINPGNHVKIIGNHDYGKGTVIRIDPDGRLAEVSFKNHIGWWSLYDLEKVK
ncbi:MAG: hypothetical protein ABFD24_06065 [Anaerolineaceae bacterium]